MTKRLERFSLGCILLLVGAKIVFALEVADYAWAITRIAPTQDTDNCKRVLPVTLLDIRP
jgi:hypothetical protein